jgi:DUF1680 family protein
VAGKRCDMPENRGTTSEFLGAAAVISAGAMANAASAGKKLAARATGAATTRSASAGVQTAAGVVPAGPLAEKIALTAERLTTRGVPAFTDEMILADVTLDTRRRFYDFSGDLSGRYLEALSVLPAPGRPRESLDKLAAAILKNQRSDGRLGRSDLAFAANEIAREHMALLWGNGRLLVGLMRYYEVTGNAPALAGARRLANFLLAVREAAKRPEVAKRLEGQGAFGYICFTQLTEGLSLLGHATGERRYFDAAAEIFALLPPRGVQHSHGYLTTLRGALQLAELSGDAALQGRVEKFWEELVASSDYIVDGSVLEYFGWGDPANAPLLSEAKMASGGLPRNEGCGLADVVRLTLQLFRMTGKLAYLEQGERCFVNAFSHNQFATGDFGSRVWFEDGFTPTSSVDRAWWCCTMYGYRAFRDVLDNVVSVQDDLLSVHMFEDIDWRQWAELRLRKNAVGATIDIDKPFAGTLRVRMPQWSVATIVERNGKALNVVAGPYAEVGRGFAAGERVQVKFAHRMRLYGTNARSTEVDSPGGKPRRAALYCGPYLMVADGQLDANFFSEPWPGNVIDLPKNAVVKVDERGRLRLALRYEHQGFPVQLETELRPLGEKPARDQTTQAVWLNWRRRLDA